MKQTFRATALSILLTITACPQEPAFVTTDESASTSTGTPTEGASSTGDASTSTSGATTTTTTDGSSSSTSTQPIDCGLPADECTSTNREWCVDLNDLCSFTPLHAPIGSGNTNYCKIVGMQCADGIPPCQLCNYIANTCGQLGGGAEECNAALADCLCRAAAHNLPIN